MSLSKAELPERSACPVERITQLEELGILVRHDGSFSAKDVHRVRLMQAFEDAGIGLDVIAKGIARGKLSYENLALYLPEPEPLTRTAGELAAEFGRSPELIARLLREFGLAPPDEGGRLRADELEILKELLDVWAIADDDVLARLARADGRNGGHPPDGPRRAAHRVAPRPASRARDPRGHGADDGELPARTWARVRT